jgi:hypothetical protein
VSEPASAEIEERIARLEQRDQQLARALELLARAGAPAPSRRDWGAFAAAIASFVGLVALAISAYTAYVQRQQLRAQVWPHLSLWTSSVNVGLYVTNQGTGPASITGVRVAVDGTPVMTWSDAVKANGYTGEWIMSTLGEMVLPSGKDITILRPADNDDSRQKFSAMLRDKNHHVAITICYCSVLRDCWVLTMPRDPDESTPRDCPIVPAERFKE